MRRLAKTAAALSLLSIMGVAAWALAQSGAKDDKAATSGTTQPMGGNVIPRDSRSR